MLSEKALIHEYKRLPGLIRKAIKDGDWRTAIECLQIMETIDWVLTDED